jgi:hypothetical protein
VGCSIVETFSKSTKPRELEEVLRLEYRSKLLNPKWAEVGPNIPNTSTSCRVRHAVKRTDLMLLLLLQVYSGGSA